MQQYLRKCSLIVSNNGKGIDLSQLRITFEITKTDNETPNEAQIKIYNLAKDTENQIINEFTRVTLQAGYQDNYGVIFDGEITQSKRGRDNGTDSYVVINASDGDSAYNYANLSTTLAAGSTQEDHINAATGAMGLDKGYVNTALGALPRGKVMYGAARDIMRQSAQSNGQNWNIQNGKVQLLGAYDILPNQAVMLNSQTGLVGGAEQSTKGIKAKALLNPMLHIGAKVIINEEDVALAKKLPKQKDGNKDNTDNGNPPEKLALVAKDGAYKIIGANFIGDTRGNDWYSDIICIDIDESAPTKKAKT